MKHLIRIAALMTAAAIFALPLGAQSRGHSSGHGSASTSYSGGSHSSGSSRGSAVSHGSSSSHSSGSVSRGSGSISRNSGSSVSRSGSVSSSSGKSASSVGGGRSSSGSSGRYSGSISRSSGQDRHSKQERPSGGSTANRPSGGSIADRPSKQDRPSGGSTANRPSGNNRPSGDFRPSGDHNRPSGGSTANRPSGDHNRPSGDFRPSGDRKRPSGGSAHRPSPGSRPYADGHRPAPGNMGHVKVHSNPGHHRVHRPEPRELRGTPARFTHYGRHHYGHYITVLPSHYVVRRYRGIDYYFWDDIWYRYYAGRYWVCRPPFGYVFSPLADAALAACTFAYYFDRDYYYDTVTDNARIIAEQNSTIAANNALIAEQNAAIAAGASLAEASGNLARSLGLVQSFADAGAEYFYNDGVFYVKGADGQYTVVVPPAGAQVEALPDDYELIELDGNTYYKVDDTVYRMTITEDGKACFEVLGQLVS